MPSDERPQDCDAQKPFSSGLFAFSWRIGCAVLASVSVLALFIAIRNAREAAIASGSQSPLNQLHLAFSNYHDRYGCFPPAWIADEHGTPMHSWRVLILPYVDALETYGQYDFSEPWNGPNNSRLAQRMPRIFHCPSEPPSNCFANFVAIVGPETAFPGAQSTRISDFEDGTDHTILLAEIANSKIPWMEPRDLDAETMSYRINDEARPSISTSRRNGAYVIFADHIQAHALTPDIRPELVKALTTIKGHEPVFMADGTTPRHLISPHSGPTTDSDLEQFTQWKNIHDLWLTRSLITDRGLENLQRAPKIDKLHLGHTRITDEGLRHLVNRSFYYTLDLSFTAITDSGIAQLARLGQVHYLNLTGTHITNSGIATLLRPLQGTTIQFSGGFVVYQTLSLQGANAEERDLKRFREFADINSINLRNTETADEDLEYLSTWPGIKTLDLSRTKITDDGLASLARLEFLEDLWIAGTEISDASVAHLKSMMKLHRLDVKDTRISDAGITELKEARPKLFIMK